MGRKKTDNFYPDAKGRLWLILSPSWVASWFKRSPVAVGMRLKEVKTDFTVDCEGDDFPEDLFANIKKKCFATLLDLANRDFCIVYGPINENEDTHREGKKAIRLLSKKIGWRLPNFLTAKDAKSLPKDLI